MVQKGNKSPGITKFSLSLYISRTIDDIKIFGMQV